MYEGDEIGLDKNDTFDRPGAIVSSSPNEQQNTQAPRTSFIGGQSQFRPRQNVRRNIVQQPAATVNAASGGERKSHNRVLIFAGIGVAVVALVVIVAIYALRGTTDTQKLNSAKQFNHFANYLLYEKDSIDAITEEFDEKTTYSLDNAFLTANQDKAKTFVHQSYSLWKKYYDTLDSSEKKVENVKTINDDIEFLKSYTELTIMSAADFKEVYDADGHDAAIEAAQKTYSSLYDAGTHDDEIKSALDSYYEYYSKSLFFESAIDSVTYANRALGKLNSRYDIVYEVRKEAERQSFILGSEINKEAIGGDGQ